VCDEGLQALWTRVDVRQPLLTGDDIAEWPDGYLDRLMAAGLLRETENARSVVCDACAEGHVEEVQLIESPPGSGFRAYIVCPENGRVRVPLARLRQWAVDLSGLARALAAGLSAAAGVEELAPGRVWFLGRTALDGQSREAFFVRGTAWPDFRTVLAGARRFQEATRPVVLVAEIMPPEDVWGGDLPAVFVLRALARLEGDSLVVDRSEMDRVLGRDRRPSAAPRGKDLALRIDPGGSLCYFRNVLVNLSKMPFDVLVLLAEEAKAGPRWVSRDRISEACWPEEWARGNPATEDQINNVASELRKALRKDGGVSAREALILVQSKSKNGYRLNLPAHEIEIAAA